MVKIHPSMRLKVKGDTVVIPSSEEEVYFRNNTVSFRLKGKQINQWVEKLFPLLNGEYTLAELTEGLKAMHQRRVYEIAEVLYKHGFVRDVSEDLPHQLPEYVVKQYASQIQFLDHLVGSGGYRFQQYRQAKVLAIGSGSFLISLVVALLESGLKQIHLLITDRERTHFSRLNELIQHAQKKDPEVSLQINQVGDQKENWDQIIQRFQAILFVSEQGDVEEISQVHALCKKAKKWFIPAFYKEATGIVGPVVKPDAIACFESAWRRVHKSVLENKTNSSFSVSFVATALLANIAVFELFKSITGVNESEENNKLFLLNLKTLEGDWHTFFPHPSVVGTLPVTQISDWYQKLEQEEKEQTHPPLLSYFAQLTSKETGIFHLWEEENLKQLPLSQCRIQVVDPISDGPASLLPAKVYAGFTHEEARREAGLSGIEQYVSRFIPQALPREVDQLAFVGIGAGETQVEGIGRALRQCLEKEWNKWNMEKMPQKFVAFHTIQDERCQYYLKALMTLQGDVRIGFSRDRYGFPVIWIRLNGQWVSFVDLHITLALRRALIFALLQVQKLEKEEKEVVLQASSFSVDTIFTELDIPKASDKVNRSILESSLKRLEKNDVRLSCLDLAVESFLKKGAAKVVGVILRKEGNK